MDTPELLNTYIEWRKSTEGIGLWKPGGPGRMHQSKNKIFQGQLRLIYPAINAIRR